VLSYEGHCNEVCLYSENEEREIKTHISTIETTSSGLATAASSFNFSASFALRQKVKHSHNLNQ